MELKLRNFHSNKVRVEDSTPDFSVELGMAEVILAKVMRWPEWKKNRAYARRLAKSLAETIGKSGYPELHSDRFRVEFFYLEL